MSTVTPDSFDLAAYLERIGLDSAPLPDADGLLALQRAHRLSIPFENLDARLGRAIDLDPAAVFAKLVTRRRGGYCFEHNSLFLNALAALGFEARPLLGRVWLFADGVPARTHCFSLVSIDGDQWIADAGFGGGYTEPMLLEAEREADVGGATHRFVHDDAHGWMLERARAGGQFTPQYSFDLQQVWPADLAMANHYTGSWPESRFVINAIAGLPRADSQLVSLMNRTFTDETGKREIANAEELRSCLADVFGIALSGEEVAALCLF